MPFFPRFHYPEAASTYPASSAFPTDILRILEGFDSAAPGSSQSVTGRRAFSPNFDVHETQHEYTLEGELPGLADKKNVSIEFTDDKTILIQGKIERLMRGWTDEAGNFEAIEGGEGGEGGEGAEVEQPTDENQGGQEKEKEKEKEERSKYWVSERSVGEFSRSFSFPGHVDIDNVKASLAHGILKVVVPKLEKKSGRKIEVA
jgi:HSP20 family molecular chaperone IbpA